MHVGNETLVCEPGAVCFQSYHYDRGAMWCKTLVPAGYMLLLCVAVLYLHRVPNLLAYHCTGHCQLPFCAHGEESFKCHCHLDLH